MTTLFATFDGQVLLPEEPISLPPNTRVRVSLEPAGGAIPETKSRSFLDVARSLDLEGPPDWSTHLEEYLYGTERGKSAMALLAAIEDDDRIAIVP